MANVPKSFIPDSIVPKTFVSDDAIAVSSHVDSRPLSLNTEPIWFVGGQNNHLDKVIRNLGLQAEKQMAIDRARFAYNHHPQELELQHRRQIAEHIVTMLDMRQKAQLSQLATADGLDNVTYLAQRLLQINNMVLEETNRIQADNTARLNQIELDKQERQKKIDYEHEQRMFHAKVGSAVDYANTPHLIWMRKNNDLKNLYKDVDETQKNNEISATARTRIVARLEKQIERLEAELDGLGGQTVSEDSGQES